MTIPKRKKAEPQEAEPPAEKKAGLPKLDRKITREVKSQTRRLPMDGESLEGETREMCAKMKQYEDLDAERKNVNAGFRDRMREIKDQIDAHREAIQHGKLTDIEVEIVRHWAEGRIQIRDNRTKKVLEERPMTDEERQPSLEEEPAGE